MKAIQCWWKDRHTDQWTGTENPKTASYKCAQLISGKGAKAIHWRKKYFYQMMLNIYKPNK